MHANKISNKRNCLYCLLPKQRNIKILNSLKSRGLSHIECTLFKCGFLIDASFLTFNVFMLFYTMCFSYLL